MIRKNHWELQLKPCPFCGSEDVALLGSIIFNGIDCKVTCNNCNILMSHMLGDMTKEQAIKLWNKRVNE